MSNEPIEINAATELFTRALQQSAARQLPIFDLFNAAAKLQSLEQRPLVAELYKIWIAST